MATLALHIGNTLQRRRHGIPVAVRQHGRKRPSGLGGDVIEPAVNRIGINIVTSRVALRTGLVDVGSEKTVDAVFEHVGVRGPFP